MPRLSQRWQLGLAVAALSLLTFWLALVPDGSRKFPTFPHEPDFKYPASAHPKALAQERPKRVAIVGAGASGSAAAWFLSRAGRVMRDRLGGKEVLGEIVVFEQEGRVGGRTTIVYPHGDETLRPQELGASIFVEANRHLVKAAKHFHLPVIEPDFGGAGVGIWDGKEFLYTTSTRKSYLSGFWDTLSAVRRYGPLSPLRTNRAVGALLKKFAFLYDPVFLAKRGVVGSIDAFGETVGLGKDLTTRYGIDWAKTVGLQDKWINEIIGGSTRVNYARNMDEIHGLGAGVSMATGGASAIMGGNWRIFFSMLMSSGATVWQHVQVTDIVPTGTSEPSFRVETNSTHAQYDDFDAVFFAAPWHLSPISKSLAANFTQDIPKQPYVHLHVTYLATFRQSPDPTFFGLSADTTVPNTILTASSATTESNFNSITWHGETRPGSGEYTVKIFSMKALDDDFLYRLLGQEPTWVLRKQWDSYPALAPISSFAPVEPMKGFHYLGAMEPWISTMETQTLSAREAVSRAVDDWWGLGMGDCRGGADAWDWTCEE